MSKDRRARPRWRQRVKAEAEGKFWLPCPICGKNFGGHEWAGTLMHSSSEGKGVCANCVEEAERRNKTAGFR
jgi:hypothetical protein